MGCWIGGYDLKRFVVNCESYISTICANVNGYFEIYQYIADIIQYIFFKLMLFREITTSGMWQYYPVQYIVVWNFRHISLKSRSTFYVSFNSIKPERQTLRLPVFYAAPFQFVLFLGGHLITSPFAGLFLRLLCGFLKVNNVILTSFEGIPQGLNSVFQLVFCKVAVSLRHGHSLMANQLLNGVKVLSLLCQ